MAATLTIPKTITHGEELVVLARTEYERLIRHREEVAHALRVIAQGEKDYREGKTIRAQTLKEALKIYARRSR